MSEPLIPQAGFDADQLAAAFDQMAASIRRNASDNFGGAFVLVPPAGVGDPVASLILNSANAKLQFWGNLKNIVDQTVTQLLEAQRLGQR